MPRGERFGILYLAESYTRKSRCYKHGELTWGRNTHIRNPSESDVTFPSDAIAEAAPGRAAQNPPRSQAWKTQPKIARRSPHWRENDV